MSRHDLLRQRQSQPRPSFATGLLHPVETLENMREITRRDADAGVIDLDMNLGLIPVSRNVHAAVFGVFYGIVQQIDEQTDETIQFTPDREAGHRFTGQFQSFGLCQRS